MKKNIFIQIFLYLLKSKKIYLLPVALATIIIGLILIGTSNPLIAPFIYTLF